MTYTAWFNETRKDGVALVGGKGANLGELSNAGLPVPPGFIVTTGAYDAFVEAGGLKDEIVGQRDRNTINAAWGSGEAVVDKASGKPDPDDTQRLHDGPI